MNPTDSHKLMCMQPGYLEWHTSVTYWAHWSTGVYVEMLYGDTLCEYNIECKGKNYTVTSTHKKLACQK